MDASYASVMKALHDQMARQRQVARELPWRFNQVDERFPHMLAKGAGKCGASKPVEGLESQMDRDRLLNLGSLPVRRLTFQYADVIAGIQQDCTACAVSPLRTRLRQLLCDLPEDIGPTRMFSKLRPQ